MRACIYARYSSDRQDPRSLDDQVRLCREHAARAGLEVVEVFTDAAISGAHAVNRPGLGALMAGVAGGRFDVVLAEALDRLARSQKDTADLYERIEYAGCRLVTVSEGEVNELHVGMKGTINAVFLRDVKKKIRRGMAGRVAEGRAAGGLGYGYRVRRELDAAGELVKGLREIVEDEAEVIRRIFREYAQGRTARDIAARLNADGVPSPAGGRWNASTINGSRQRRTGILYNEAYRGRLVWNRSTMVKNPDTGKRIHRINPPDEWQFTDKPDWRIVTDDEWTAAHAMKNRYSGLHQGHKAARRPRHLLSGILKCGCCGAGWTVISKNRTGCSRARESGDCDNRKTISMTKLETRVFAGLERELLDPDRVSAAVGDIIGRMRRERRDTRRREAEIRRELAKVEAEIEKLVDAIAAGLLDKALRTRFEAATATRDTLQTSLASMDDTDGDNVVALLPGMAEIFADKVRRLSDSLNCQEDRVAAIETLRAIFTRIEIHPLDGKGQFQLEVTTDLPTLVGLNKGSTKRTPALVAEEGVALKPTFRFIA